MNVCPIVQIYGEDSIEVQIVRFIRDNVLSKTPEGREMIELYYQWSPAIVGAMEEDSKFKTRVKSIIDEILLMIQVRGV